MEENDERTGDQGMHLAGRGQSVHWVFVTDCSAYMYNQGNLHLASAAAVDQPGEFTWIVVGCEHPAQMEAMKKLAHPRARVWHTKASQPINPDTGKVYKAFQASNRPTAVRDWWRATQPEEEAIGIVDPDEFWMRPVLFVASPRLPSEQTTGPWETQAVKPKVGSGAMYGIGCTPERFSEETLRHICGARAESCVHWRTPAASGDCRERYASGPPWVLHRADAEDVFNAWPDTAVRTHEAWPDMLAEQASFGLTQMQFRISNHLDTFWFLSAPGDRGQPWGAVEHIESSYDPCSSRAPPPTTLPLPPLWHACSTYEIPALKGKGFRLHKDHVPKDLLDCDTPLLHYAPADSLASLERSSQSSRYAPTDFAETWSVCAYTNLINSYASVWKNKFCERPNLQPSFSYPDHAESFLNPQSPMEKIFRKGGWQDIDYTLGAR